MRRTDAIRAVAELRSLVTGMAPSVRRAGLPLDISSVVDRLDVLGAQARTADTPGKCTQIAVEAIHLSRALHDQTRQAQARLN